MAQALIFHYRPSDNFLVKMNPNAKLIALLSYSIVISSSQPASVFILALIPLFISFAIKLPAARYIKESAFFIVLAVIMFISSLASEGDITKVAASPVAFLSMVLAAILLTDSTMPDDLSRSLGSALSHVFGKAAYVLSAIIEITLAMIPTIIDSALGMVEARKARGEVFFSHPIHSISQLSVSILSDILDKAEIYIDALYSRGYDASKRRSTFSYSFSDAVVIILSILLLILKIFYKFYDNPSF